MNACRGSTDPCGCGCALSDEPCPCWRSCSSCTCTFRRRSSPGRPSAPPTRPPQTGSPPPTEGPGRSAHSWGQLQTKTHSDSQVLLIYHRRVAVQCSEPPSHRLETAPPTPSLRTRSPKSCWRAGFAASGIPGIPSQSPQARSLSPPSFFPCAAPEKIQMRWDEMRWVDGRTRDFSVKKPSVAAFETS